MKFDSSKKCWVTVANNYIAFKCWVGRSLSVPLGRSHDAVLSFNYATHKFRASHEDILQKVGEEQPDRMGVAATCTCNERAYWKHRERGELEGGTSITNSFIANSFVTTPFTLATV